MIIHNLLQEHLQKIITASHYPITFSGDNPNILNRWLVKSELAVENRFDHPEPYLSTDGEILLEHEQAFLPTEELEKNWRYYISDDKATLYHGNSPQKEFSKDHDKYIYALCTVFCKERRNVVIYANGITPIRMWINGQIVLTNNFHYHIKPYLFSFQFEKGLNMVLVEKTLFLKDLALNIDPDNFMIILKPYHFLLNEELNYFFDQDLLKDLENSYTIIPEQAFFTAGQAVRFMVLPRYFNKPVPETVKVSIIDSMGELRAALTAETAKVVTVDADCNHEGVLRITATSPGNPGKNGDVYVFYGDFMKTRDQWMAAAGKRRDCNAALMNTVMKLSEIPDINTGCFRNFPQTIQDRLYYLLFEKIFEFEQYLHSPESPGFKAVFDVFKHHAVMVNGSEIDDGYGFYSIHFPAGYDCRKTYPLAISVQYGYGMSVFPIVQQYVQKQRFSGVIVVNICGRGGLNQDYIHEVNLFHLLETIMQNYNIDRDRVYITGSCTGTLKSFGLAFRRPDLFAAVTGVNGTIRLDLKHPDFELLRNIDNTVCYQLCNIEDNAFNGSRVQITLGHLNKIKNWNFTGYSHDDFDEFLNQGKLLREIMAEKRDKYPGQIEYVTYDPIYNRSFWLTVEYIKDLSQKARIKAEIRSRRFIDIQLENIKSFSLLIHREAMGLDGEIEIGVDHLKSQLQLDRFTKVTVIRNASQLLTTATVLTEERFIREYDDLRIDRRFMGIKQLYITKCKIIQPDDLIIKDRVFAKTLIHVLQFPLKERNRNYQYGVLKESEINDAVLSESNFIYGIDTGNTNEIQRQILARCGISASASGISYDNAEYRGEYFGLVKCENPFNDAFSALIIVFNNHSCRDELVKFFNSFDRNGLFYSDVVIFHRGSYHSFRKNKF
jgi:hypothetical protein